jgi:Ferritin-like domain
LPLVQTPATTPPERPTSADTEVLAGLQGLELTASDLYQAAIDAGADDGAGVLATLRSNHESYANRISGLIGGAAPQARNDLVFDQFSADFETADVEAVAVAGYNLESGAVATYLDALAALEGTDGAAVVASILMVESRHAAVLADLAGQGDDLDTVLTNPATPFTVGSGSTS